MACLWTVCLSGIISLPLRRCAQTDPRLPEPGETQAEEGGGREDCEAQLCVGGPGGRQAGVALLPRGGAGAARPAAPPARPSGALLHPCDLFSHTPNAGSRRAWATRREIWGLSAVRPTCPSRQPLCVPPGAGPCVSLSGSDPFSVSRDALRPLR